MHCAFFADAQDRWLCIVHCYSVSAVVAGECVVVSVIGKTDIAIRAFWYIAALWTFHVRCKTPTVLE